MGRDYVPEDITKAAIAAWQKHRGQSPISDTMLRILTDAINTERENCVQKIADAASSGKYNSLADFAKEVGGVD